MLDMWTVKVYQAGFTVRPGEVYRLVYDHRSSHNGRIFGVDMIPPTEPWGRWYCRGFYTSDTTWQTDTIELNVNLNNFQGTVDSLALLNLNFGGDTGTVWIDNISLELIAGE